MRNVLFTFLMHVFFTSTVWASEGNEENNKLTSFEVIVVDALTEEPIPAARVKIDQKDIEAYTDFDGFLRIDELALGTYDIEISFISYQKQHLKGYHLNKSGNKVLIRLQP